MSSFKRKVATPSQLIPKGTKPSPALSSLLLTSFGVPSLDDVLGGGIQLGTTLSVLNPDPHSSHTDLLQKYFIAQGLINGQIVHVFDANARDLVESCMWCPSEGSASRALTDDEGVGEEDNKVKIAWRYENMQKFRTSIFSACDEEEEYCRPFDLTQSISPDLIESFLDSGQLHLEGSCMGSSTGVFDDVLRRIHDVLTSQSESEKRCTRIAIPACMSLVWGDISVETVIGFMLRLRALLRSHPLACAFITFPADISADSWSEDGWLEKLAWASDACLSLTSASADPAASAIFPSHHGLLKILKLPAFQTLVPASDRFSTLRGLAASSSSNASASSGVGENNLAFKVKRKRFIIETFHLDLEGGVGERRTTPAPSAKAEGGGHHHKAEGEEKAQAYVEVQIASKLTLHDTYENGKLQEPELASAQEKKGILKKPRKRVGFQVNKPDVLDF